MDIRNIVIGNKLVAIISTTKEEMENWNESHKKEMISALEDSFKEK